MKSGKIASQFGGAHLELRVLESPQGFYIGTQDSYGCPFSRESVEYWAKRDEALAALQNNSWTQRDAP